jgi:hypothetical protein
LLLTRKCKYYVGDKMVKLHHILQKTKTVFKIFSILLSPTD